ncbi:BTAD domain-containing putative transcriptional regulator [Streptomyces sp. NPDC020883]|uniref:BTAD domain-containing putative transcriptional regulator n=1 Tax=Streptomyces sp. NPDC020883 TaxID=3365099 RepID=UPI0037B16765
MTHHAALRERLTAAVTALGTLAVTLALLAGMPYVLWHAAGIPWPDSIHSWRDLGERLVQPLSDPLVINLLAVVGWACWAAFAFTVVREICWYAAHLPQLLHDRRAHHDHVAALSLKGSLAALCIGTLVVALLSLWRPATASARQPSPANEPRALVAATVPLTPTTTYQSSTASKTRPAAPGPAADAEAVRHIEYTVVEGDTLWDIANAHLGDGLKWPRIYALNKDRVQHDGDRLDDPDLLRVGWRLAIPLSPHHPASPATIPVPERPVLDDTPQASSTPTASPMQPSLNRNPAPDKRAESQHRLPTSRQNDNITGQTEAAASGPAAIEVGEASLIGITAAAGLLAARRYWYIHQRRRRDPEAEVPALSPLVDKAAQAAHAATQPRRQHGPDDLIVRRTPPQPPRTADSVTIGVSGSAEVPVDVLATAGGHTWNGPGAEGAARALLTGILTAAERQRPGAARIRAVVTEDLCECLLPGLPPQFTALTQTPDTADAVHLAEQHLVAHARIHHDRDTPVPGPMASDRSDETEPGSLILMVAPGAAHLGQVQAVAARSRPGVLTVLTLGTLLPGAEHWHIAADGAATGSGPRSQHPSGLELFHLTPDAGREMTEVLLGAHGQRPHLRVLPNQQPSSREGQSQPASTEEPEPEPDPIEPAAPVDPRPAPTTPARQVKPVRLHVLGPVTLYALGHEDPVGTNLRPEVHEFLALLAAHPTGLVASDIADKLHLEPGTEQNALKNLRRAVRRALRTATGITAQEFILHQGDLHRLHPELVETDLADFTRILKGAFSNNGDSTHDALNSVQEALGHYRGPFAQGADHLWADAIREHLTTQATDAVLRLAHQAEHSDASPQRQDAVLTLLEHLGAFHPDHERLAQHAIRLYQAAGRHDAARHTYTRLERHLADLGLEPDPATRTLVTPRAHSRQMG